MDKGLSTSHQINFEAVRTWVYPTNYDVRKYQQDITETCLFHNTLVSLPTGMGKTLIAAVVMYNFWRWFPRGIVIFMAPTKPLVSQQILACRDIMGIPESEFAQLDGTIPVQTRDTIWDTKSIFFCTPQVVENDLLQGRLKGRRVVCVVIDEAHRASGNYAYVKVIYELYRLNSQFRILALSATPGSDKRAVQNVLYNLHISKIEWRSEDDPDVAPYVQDREVEIVRCKPGAKGANGWMSMTKKKVNDCLREVTRHLVRGGLLLSEEPDHVNPFILNEIDRNISSSGDVSMKNVLSLAQRLTEGRKILVESGSAALWNHLEDIIARFDHHKPRNEIERDLMRSQAFTSLARSLRGVEESMSTGGLTHKGSQQGITCANSPKLSKLQEILVGHFRGVKSNEGGSRAIVFVALRATVHDIVAELNHATELRVAQFVGQSGSTSSGKSSTGTARGQTQKEQEEVLRAFNRGTFNVLVATCIAEEGLDIAEVDLIVSFDVTQSPVRMLQRNGRTARKKSGRVVMLVTEGKEEEKVHKSSDSIVRVNASLMNALTSLTLSQRSPRMIPDDVQPVMREECLGRAREPPPSGKRHPDTLSSRSPTRQPSIDTVMRRGVQGAPQVLTGSDKRALGMSSWFSTPNEDQAEDAFHGPSDRTDGRRDAIDIWDVDSSVNSSSCQKTNLSSRSPTEILPLAKTSLSDRGRHSQAFSSVPPSVSTSAIKPSRLCGICNREMTPESTLSLCGECSAVLAASLAADDEDWGQSRHCPHPPEMPERSSLHPLSGVYENSAIENGSLENSKDSDSSKSMLIRPGNSPDPHLHPATSRIQGRQQGTTFDKNVIVVDCDSSFEKAATSREQAAKTPGHMSAPASPVDPCSHNKAEHIISQNGANSSVYFQLVNLLRPSHSSASESASLQPLNGLLGGVLRDMSDSDCIMESKVDKMTCPEGVNFGLFFTDPSRRALLGRVQHPVLGEQGSATAEVVEYRNHTVERVSHELECSEAIHPSAEPTTTSAASSNTMQNGGHSKRGSIDDFIVKPRKAFEISASVFADTSSDESDSDEDSPSRRSERNQPSNRQSQSKSSPNQYLPSDKEGPKEISSCAHAGGSQSVDMASNALQIDKEISSKVIKSTIYSAPYMLCASSPFQSPFATQENPSEDTKRNVPARTITSSSSSIYPTLRDNPNRHVTLKAPPNTSDVDSSPSQYSLYTPSPVTSPVKPLVKLGHKRETTANSPALRNGAPIHSRNGLSKDRSRPLGHASPSNFTASTPVPRRGVKYKSPDCPISANRSDCIDASDLDSIPCAICTACDIDEKDPGVFCDGPCGCFTHLTCYGMKQVPSADNFYCDSCAYVLETQKVLRCTLCRQSGGMLRRSPDRRWVHPICVLFTPELTTDPKTMLVTDLSALDPERETLRCIICHRSGGANIQCACGDCITSMHPFCAHKESKQLVIRCDDENYPIYELYCDKHKKRVIPDNIVNTTIPLDDVLVEDFQMSSEGISSRPGGVRIKGAEDEIWNMDTVDSKPPIHRHNKRLRLMHRASSTKKARHHGNKENIEESTKRMHVAALFETEAGHAGDSESEEDEEEDGSQCTSFINDGDYTQAPDSVESGMAMYHALHRQFEQTPSPMQTMARYNFRGGSGLPITNRILKQLADDENDELFELNTSLNTTMSYDEEE